MENPPTIKFPDDNWDERIKKLVYSKEKCWEYEKEIRLCITNSNELRSFIPIPKDLIFGVIVGAKMKNEKVEQIKDITQKNNYKLFYETELGIGYKTTVISGKNGIPMRQFIN